MGLSRSARVALLCAALLAPSVVRVGSAAAQGVSERRVQAAIDDASRGLGQSIAGGSALTAPAGALGGLGHFQVGAALGVTRLSIEDPTRDAGTLDFFLPVGTLSAALGLTDGLDLAPGLGGFLALDVLGRWGFVTEREDFRRVGRLTSLGARVGILDEGLAAPAVSLSAYRTWTSDVRFGDPGGDEITFSGDVKATSLRVDVSKSFVLMTPYAGVGLDRTSIEARYFVPASRSTGDHDIEGRLDSGSSHHKLYVGLGLNLLGLAADVEGGAYDGGAFGALGVRLGI